jgi:hypothetical protein
MKNPTRLSGGNRWVYCRLDALEATGRVAFAALAKRIHSLVQLIPGNAAVIAGLDTRFHFHRKFPPISRVLVVEFGSALFTSGNRDRSGSSW